MANLNKSASAAKKIDKYYYNFNDVLGTGSFGKVYQGRDESTGEKVAVKVIDLRAIEKNEQVLKNLSNEIKVMKSLMKNVANPNIVKLYDVLTTTNNVYIIQEFCNGGDLRDLLKKRGRIPEPEALKILKDILSGFTILKQKNIIHRDLKPENILISSNVFKIADFGFAKNVENFRQDLLKSLVGTPLYMSPQILQHSQYTAKSDIWSIGLIYYEMLYGITPYDAKSIWDLVKYIESKQLEFPKEIPATDLSKSFIRKCLEKEEENRISWEEVFSYPLFQDCFQYKKKMSVMEEKGAMLIKYLRDKITSQNIDINEFFKAFDTSNNEKLEISEFTEIINAIDPDMEKDEVEFIFNKIDVNGDNSISIKEFFNILFPKSQANSNAMQIEYSEETSKPQRISYSQKSSSENADKKYNNSNNERSYLKFQQIKERLRILASKPNFDVNQLFWTFDISEDHILDLNEFAKLTQILDQSLTYEDVLGVFKIIDTNNDGKITLHEFKENFFDFRSSNPKGYLDPNLLYKNSPSRGMLIEEKSIATNGFSKPPGPLPYTPTSNTVNRLYQDSQVRYTPRGESAKDFSYSGFARGPPQSDQYNGQRSSLHNKANEYESGLELKYKSNSTSYRKQQPNSLSFDLKGGLNERGSQATDHISYNNYEYRSGEGELSSFGRQANNYANASFGVGYGTSKIPTSYDPAYQTNNYMVNGLFSRLKIRISQTYPSVSKLFSSYDINRRGYLNRVEFQNMILNVEPTFSLPEADTMFNRIDYGGRDYITCQEFQDNMK